MIGDLLLKITTNWKQCWCIHDYRFEEHIDYGPQGFDLYRCPKCGRTKSVEVW